MRMNEEEGGSSRPLPPAGPLEGAPRPSGGEGDDDDDDDVNPFLPGPVALLQTLMRRRQERERQEPEQKTVVIRE